MDRKGSMETWLIGAVLVAGLAAAVAGLFPWVPCPACNGRVRLYGTFACEGCGDRTKVTLLERGSWRRAAWERRSRVDLDRY